MQVIRKTNRIPALPGYTQFADVMEPMNRIAKLFEPFGFALPVLGPPAGVVPPVELIETAEELVLTCELPGMEEKEIELIVENNVLLLRGEKKAAWTGEPIEEPAEAWKGKAAEAPRYLVYERAYGAFVRSFTLPATIDAAKIVATFVNGILEVRLPKVPEAKGRRIEIGRN